ncbi:hypothetical protein KC19_12G119700 [Ceratodon purpureus]|uniref:Secreted protein n=1 Tax=Ceratodon purpureus TaxID=3225 RepID=A0A8T0G7H1_CERPU|nr:hypothetical protein KC19_12G119700 [Ceratodon purpureus]
MWLHYTKLLLLLLFFVEAFSSDVRVLALVIVDRPPLEAYHACLLIGHEPQILSLTKVQDHHHYEFFFPYLYRRSLADLLAWIYAMLLLSLMCSLFFSRCQGFGSGVWRGST